MNKLILYIRNRIVVDKNNTLEIDKSVKIRNSRIKIRGNGNKLVIEKSCNLYGVNIEIRGENSLIKIGANSIIGKNTYLSAKESCNITIGENCMFSRNINIMTSDGHGILQNDKRINNAKSIEIGNHVWLADNVTILKGSKISDNSVVGIGSIVTKKFEEKNLLIVGNSGNIAKRNIKWTTSL